MKLKTNESIPNVLSKQFAVRIPSQDKHSAVNLKIIDFLPPMYSSTIMAAYELIEISGSDHPKGPQRHWALGDAIETPRF